MDVRMYVLGNIFLNERNNIWQLEFLKKKRARV